MSRAVTAVTAAPTDSPPADRALRAVDARWALASLALSTLLSALGTSIASVALPALAQAFAASFAGVQWVVLAYLLATTVCLVGAGRLGDAVGRRRALLAGLGLFTAGSALCGLATALGTLIAARALQGVGAAALLALSMALVGDTVPPARTGSAMGLLGATSALGTALGPSLGGFLVAAFGWRAIFLVNVPLGLVALLLTARHLPAAPPAPAARVGRFDALGTLLLAATLSAYALAATLGRGGFGGRELALGLAALVGAGLFGLVEARASSPLLAPAMLRGRGRAAGCALGALVSTVVMATLVVGPFYLTRALALGPALVGVVMTAGPLVAALVGLPAGRLVDRLGAGPATALGLLGSGLGCGLLAVASPRHGILGYALPIAVLTAHYALFQAANNTAVMAGVPAGERGVVAGVLSLARSLGLVTGTAVMGAVFAAATGARDVATAGPESIARGLHATFAVATGLVALALVLLAATRSWRRSAAPVDRPGDVAPCRIAARH